MVLPLLCKIKYLKARNYYIIYLKALTIKAASVFFCVAESASPANEMELVLGIKNFQ